jgi:hypothetical protein
VRTGWQDTTSYYGDARSFLFSLYPRINVYRTTGKATNYVYLNTKKTFSELPIGISLETQLEPCRSHVCHKVCRATDWGVM